MAGRISDRDIAAIRESTRIEDVVGDYVQLRRAGADSLKGLCPFHDEKSPSFHVRPNHGHFHCFGCGEGGDVYAFLQKIEHVSFVESVEMLADRIGYTVTYSGASATNVQRDKGSRSRLIAANAAALGMVIDQAPAYLRLSDASIVGDPGTSAFASNVDPLSSAVPNALVAQVPLITDPNSTIASARAADATPAPVDPQTPPPIADVLPIPATH